LTITGTNLQKENPLLTNGLQQKKQFISLDIETGGENCGIIQLSAQIFRMVQHYDTAAEKWEYQKCQAFEAAICTTGVCVPNVCSTY